MIIFVEPTEQPPAQKPHYVPIPWNRGDTRSTATVLRCAACGSLDLHRRQVDGATTWWECGGCLSRHSETAPITNVRCLAIITPAARSLGKNRASVPVICCPQCGKTDVSRRHRLDGIEHWGCPCGVRWKELGHLDARRAVRL